MRFSIYLRKLKVYLLNSLIIIIRVFFKNRPKISLLIPFSSKDVYRNEILQWIIEYWKYELPNAEIIIGTCNDKVFCKAKALNNAVKKSRGKVLVIIDADAYITGKVIESCADKILDNLENHLWYVPYRRLFRLTKNMTRVILDSNPKNPLRIHPHKEFIENTEEKSKYGHRYGAMIMMFHREAYELLGCFDERFKGWGGEDIALLRALDTLYGKHKTVNDNIFHLWHPVIGNNYTTRRWEGQDYPQSNSNLANKYHKATRHPSIMRRLVDDGCIFNS